MRRGGGGGEGGRGEEEEGEGEWLRGRVVLSQESGHGGGGPGCSLVALRLVALRQISSHCSFASLSFRACASLSFRAFSCSAFRACSSAAACTAWSSAWRSSRWRFLFERSPSSSLSCSPLSCSPSSSLSFLFVITFATPPPPSAAAAASSTAAAVWLFLGSDHFLRLYYPRKRSKMIGIFFSSLVFSTYPNRHNSIIRMHF